MGRVLVLAVLLLLGACTTPVVRSDVTRFHTLAAAQSGTSFTIVPDPPQVGSLEFQDYASRVADALSAQGWVPVPPGGTADARVSLRWGVGPAETEFWQSPSSVYTGMGWGGSSPWYGGGVGYYDPFPYWETRSVTTYPRWLSVQILDAKAGTRRVLFEGRAVASGKSQEITPTMPYLVQALFTGFPGANGTTVRVNVPIPE